MNSDMLDEALENISLEFVMIDFNDKDELRSLINQFEHFNEISSECGYDNVSESILKVIEKIKIVLDCDSESEGKSMEKTMDEIGNMISEIQHALKDLSSDSAGKYIDYDKLEEKKETDAAEENKIQNKNIVDNEASKALLETGLIHPDRLPSHLDDESFAQFLAHQDNVLVKMEELILEFENTKSDESAAKLQRVLHTLKGESGFLNLKEVESVCHSMEDILEDKNSVENIDLFLKVKDWLQETFSYYKGEGEEPESMTFLNGIKQFEKRQSKIKKPGKRSPKIDIHESINVNAKRLDRMLDMIGELVIAESILTQNNEVKKLKSPALMRDFSVLTKITKELQEIGLSLRMVPIKSTFMKMSRIIRDISKKSGKEINFQMFGEDSELDKNIVDKIGDPLLHIVRNAVDHGIESVEERNKNGKDRTAIISMRAYQRSGFFHIEIEDDGRGIDHNKIRDKAVEKGLIPGDANLDKKEIINLIFESGFSTSENVTDISGRGVGMDVVRTSIDELRGSIQVESNKGKGTLFNLSIPLTLAIIDGMVIRVGKERYIIPSLSIVTSNRLSDAQITNVMNKERTIDVQGDLLPLISLNELFNVEDIINGSFKLYVVVEEDGEKAAIIVDELLGKQQIVIKNLGEGLMNIKGISGGAIMPDGLVGLILDVSTLIGLSRK